MPGLRERRALLGIMSVPHLGPVALRRILAEFGRGGEMERFFELSGEELTRRFRLRPAAVQAVTERREWILAEAASLERDLRERDIHWLVANDSAPALRWPRRLSQAPWSLPPVLFTRGNEELLDRPAVAFLNSSDAPPRALELTDALADRLAARGMTVVSGHNTPGYKAAAVAAARHGAPRLLALDRGLMAAPEDTLDREPVAPARVWAPEWDGLAGLAVSPFRPRDPWARSNSRLRDELVASLATAVVAVHVRAGGVMESIARTALRSGMFLGVWADGSGDGNAALLAESQRNVASLTATDGVDAIVERLALSISDFGFRISDLGTGSTGEPSVSATSKSEIRNPKSEIGQGRAARRWDERERQFLYGLLEAACGSPLDADRLLDFAGSPRHRRQSIAERSVAIAACDATGLRDPRPALQGALEALADGGWLAALTGAGIVAGDDSAEFRHWLAAQGRVAAVVSLPVRTGAEPSAALLLHKAAPASGPVLSIAPDSAVEDAAAQHRYLLDARARVQAHLILTP